jgi:hypothetical protein
MWNAGLCDVVGIRRVQRDLSAIAAASIPSFVVVQAVYNASLYKSRVEIGLFGLYPCTDIFVTFSCSSSSLSSSLHKRQFRVHRINVTNRLHFHQLGVARVGILVGVGGGEWLWECLGVVPPLVGHVYEVLRFTLAKLQDKQLALTKVRAVRQA